MAITIDHHGVPVEPMTADLAGTIFEALGMWEALDPAVMTMNYQGYATGLHYIADNHVCWLYSMLAAIREFYRGEGDEEAPYG